MSEMEEVLQEKPDLSTLAAKKENIQKSTKHIFIKAIAQHALTP